MKGGDFVSHYLQKGVVVMDELKWPIIDKDGTAYDEDEFVRKYENAVFKACHHAMGIKSRDRELFGDVSQHAWMAVLRNLSKYDTSRGHALSTFVFAYARGGALHFLRDFFSSVKCTRAVNEAKIKITKRLREQDLPSRYGDAEEIAKELDMKVTDVKQAIIDLSNLPRSLDAPITNKDSSKEITTFGDNLYIKEEPEDERIYLLEQAILMLTERERFLVEAKIKETTQAEIGLELNISQMHVSRLQRRALKRVREFVTILQKEA